MNEFIEKLIGRLEKLTHDNPMVTSNYILRKDAINAVNQLAEEYKLFGNSEQVNGGWIPCDENLPNHNQTVIFQTEDGMVETGYYDVNEDWCVNDSYFPNAFRFIAWQPLPEPYIVRQQSQEGGV